MASGLAISLDRATRVQHVLRLQHLTPSARGAGVLATVEDLVGLHATNVTTPYLSLFARVEGFCRDQLDHELYAVRRLVKVRCMRSTVFILPRALVAAAQAATRSRNLALSGRYLAAQGINPDLRRRLTRQIVDLLRGSEMTIAQIRRTLQTPADLSAVVGVLCDEGTLIRGRPARGWRDRAQTYAVFAEWLQDVADDSVGEYPGTTEIVRRYIRAFGPVEEEDVVWWTGFGATRVRAALAVLAPELVPVHIDGRPEPLLLAASRADELGAPAGGQAPEVAFLPSLDPLPMGYRHRDWYLEPQYREWVYDRSGNCAPTIWVDGHIAGVWDVLDSGAIGICLLERVGQKAHARIARRGAVLGAWLSETPGPRTAVVEVDGMEPLSGQPAGSFQAPLRRRARG